MLGDLEKGQLPAVGEAEGGLRLDAWLAGTLGIGRRAAIRLASSARVNGRRVAKSHLVAAGDEVRLDAGAREHAESGLEPVLLETAGDLLVLSKPAGLASVALSGQPGPSVARWLERMRPECAGIGRPGEAGLVHRLDGDTSGLLLAARTPQTYDALRLQFRLHQVEKTYRAVVEGCLERSIEVDAAIGQHRKSRTRVRALRPGDHPRYAVTPAETRITPVRAIGAFTLVEARTRTGARHQVRAHLAHAGHPLVGDRRYGGESVPGIDRFLLHAASLSWLDPGSEEGREAGCEPPAGWQEAVKVLRRSA